MGVHVWRENDRIKIVKRHTIVILSMGDPCWVVEMLFCLDVVMVFLDHEFKVIVLHE